LAPRRDQHDHAAARTHPAVLRSNRPLIAEHPNVARVRAYALERGIAIAVRQFGSSTRTAEDAAREIGTTVERIVKSLVFLAGSAGASVVLCSGGRRVDESKLAAVLGVEVVRRARADEAKAITGYSIGGVPPFAHARPCRVIADRGLLDFPLVWAAAGLPDAVFPIAPAELVRIAAGEVADLARRSSPEGAPEARPQRSSSSSGDSSSPSYSSE
jgi:prolyl-tRNA editing enzyme YbaK/EbsC (Cys-tRNA(Pro) deacylase)